MSKTHPLPRLCENSDVSHSHCALARCEWIRNSFLTVSTAMTYLTHQGHEVSTTCGSGWVLLALIYLDVTNDPPATAGGTDFMTLDASSMSLPLKRFTIAKP